MMAYEYVKKCYGVNPVPGKRVKVAGDIPGNQRQGTISRKRHYDHYVYVRLDDYSKSVRCHPLDLIYLD